MNLPEATHLGNGRTGMEAQVLLGWGKPFTDYLQWAGGREANGRLGQLISRAAAVRSKHLANTNSFFLRSTLKRGCSHYPHFTDGENEALRDCTTSLESHMLASGKAGLWTHEDCSRCCAFLHSSSLPLAGQISPAGDIRVRR